MASIWMQSDPTEVSVPLDHDTGLDITESLIRSGLRAVESLEDEGTHALLARGVLRGSRLGESFAAMIDLLDHADPVRLRSPFEGSDLVSGGVHTPVRKGDRDYAVARLRWSSCAADLPLHTHEHSDRVIVVLRGRGFFHWSDQTLDVFDGTSVRTVAARELDGFVFRRGLLHTFSTAGSHMELVSCQLPFLPFDDPRQYTLPPRPSHRWVPRSETSLPDAGRAAASS